MKRFIQVMDYSHVSTIIQVSTTIGHLFWAYYFIIAKDMNVAGAAISLNITYILNFLAQEIYILCIGRNTKVKGKT